MLPALPLQLIVSGRYDDRFQRRDRQWRFVERRVPTEGGQPADPEPGEPFDDRAHQKHRTLGPDGRARGL